MFLTLAAAVLPLVPVAADDARLSQKKTFVSAAAQAELEAPSDERVLCLDRKRAKSICLTEAEWTKAIKLAENAPKKGPRPFIPQDLGNYQQRSSFDGIPAALTTRRF